jgi:hypothetical protein
VTSVVDLPRSKLAELVSQHGTSICHDATDCDARLTSECGLEYGNECAALVAAVDAGIVAELQHGLLSSVPRSVLLRRLSQRLANGSNLPAYLAQWSVECWALALGVVRASDDLLSLKLEGLVPLLDAAATNGAISTDRLDRLVRDAAGGGIDEANARAYIARYVARRGWVIGESLEQSAGTRRPAGEGRTVPRGMSIFETRMSPARLVASFKTDAVASAPIDTPALKAADPRHAEPHPAGGAMFRWGSGAAIVLVILAAIAVTAIDRHVNTPSAADLGRHCSDRDRPTREHTISSPLAVLYGASTSANNRAEHRSHAT